MTRQIKQRKHREQRLEVTVTLPEGSRTCPVGTSIRDLLPSLRDETGLDYVGARVNNDVVSLTYPLEVDSVVVPLSRADSHGFRIYRHSLSFLLARSVRECFPEAAFSIEHSLGTGFYCIFSQNGEPNTSVGPGQNNSHNGITSEQLAVLDAHLRDIVKRNVPIERRKISFLEAVTEFEEASQRDKLNLLRFRNPPKIVIYWCEGFSDLAHGPLVDRTGCLTDFRLIPYPPGFVIQFPTRDAPHELPPFEEQDHLFQIFKEHKEWGRILGVRTAGSLNEIIARRDIADFIRIAEAFHEKKIARIADHITGQRSRIKWVLIAGPSSAGKTTFAKRLAIQLRVNGLRPVTISTDDYFYDREHTPRDEYGDYDFENIEAIDLDLFNNHIKQLDGGNEVEVPSFSFEKGIREWKGTTMRIETDQLILVEGIHALNPRLTFGVPDEHKFRIYISALTQLNLDLHNRVSTTDNRLMRRMIRDYQFRGHSAQTTLAMWPSVRRGEKRWVFPFQREADIAFNSALDYELAMLKPLVEPLLLEVKPTNPDYVEARRLMEFLSNFLAVPHYLIPPTSILREFIGQSSFNY